LIDGNSQTLEWLEIIESFLKALFGYKSNPSLLEIIVYPNLLILIGIISMKLWKRSSKFVVMKFKKGEQVKPS
jgi:high-affinity Fe2+/Pb2+ permease